MNQNVDESEEYEVSSKNKDARQSSLLPGLDEVIVVNEEREFEAAEAVESASETTRNAIRAGSEALSADHPTVAAEANSKANATRSQSRFDEQATEVSLLIKKKINSGKHTQK